MKIKSMWDELFLQWNQTISLLLDFVFYTFQLQRRVPAQQPYELILLIVFYLSVLKVFQK